MLNKIIIIICIFIASYLSAYIIQPSQTLAIGSIIALFNFSFVVIVFIMLKIVAKIENQ